MHYNYEIEIKKPIDFVIKMFDNPDNLKKWQTGLLSFETIEGEAGKPGTKSLLKYQMGKREIEMVETIEVNNLPQEFSGTYEAKNVFNRVVNRFEKIDAAKTLYKTENTFEFRSFNN